MMSDKRPTLTQLADAILPPFDRQKRQQMLLGQTLALKNLPKNTQSSAKEIWQEGSSRLWQYGDPNKPAVLFIPSLINSYKILDLSPSRSVVKYLAANGFNPVILEWGILTAQEYDFALEDYQQRLQRAWQVCKPEHIAGYCMGATFASKLIQQQEGITKLLLISPPADFREMLSDQEHQQLQRFWPWLQEVIRRNNYLPADVIQYLLVARNPQQVAKRYQNFAVQYEHLTDTERQSFALIDAWLTAAMPLAKKVAMKTIGNWYLDRLSVIKPNPQSTLVITGEYDHVVPFAASAPLKENINSTHYHFPTGHLGLVAGRKSLETVWKKVIEWL